ncbi:unnamed protein product, partial [Polarella glacialis]
ATSGLGGGGGSGLGGGGSGLGEGGGRGLSQIPEVEGKEPIQQPESSVPLRLLLAAEPFISAVPSAKWEDLRPVRHLLEELRANPGIRAACPDIESIAGDIEFKADDLPHDEEAFRFTEQMDQDCLQAILAYTHDAGQKQGSLYFELNNCLRERSPEGRAGLMRTWGDFMHYFLKGLSKLEPVSGVVYRGLPEKGAVIAQYKVGRPIQWGAFSSTSRAKEVAKKSFAGDKHSAIILKITITSGRRLGPLSFFPMEDEILLSPRCRFVAWLQLVLCLIVCIYFFRFVHFFICLCFLNVCLSPTCI